jgi:uncharacterized cupredoxin-like copper-binding protein
MARWRAAVVFLAAAAGIPSSPPATPAVRTVVLDIHFSRFSSSALSVPRAEVVRFVVRNDDPIAHELIVGGQSAQDRHEHGTEAHHGERPGEVSVPAGATATTTYAFGDRGRLLFGCHLPGHWAYGMRGTIEIR